MFHFSSFGVDMLYIVSVSKEAPPPSAVDLLDLDDGGSPQIAQSPSPQGGDMLLLDMVRSLHEELRG